MPKLSLYDRAYLQIDHSPLAGFDNNVDMRLPPKHGLNVRQIRTLMITGIEHNAKNPTVPEFMCDGRKYHITQDYNSLDDGRDLKTVLAGLLSGVEPIVIKHTITFIC